MLLLEKSRLCFVPPKENFPLVMKSLLCNFTNWWLDLFPVTTPFGNVESQAIQPILLQILEKVDKSNNIIHLSQKFFGF